MVSRTKSRRSRRARTRSKPRGRCQRLLRKHMGDMMAEYNAGKFVSRAQAAAVAYSKTRKSCGASWSRSRSRMRSKSRTRSKSRRTKSRSRKSRRV